MVRSYEHIGELGCSRYLATSHSTTTWMFSMLSDTAMTGTDMSSMFARLLES